MVFVEYEDLNDYDDDEESGRLPILKLKLNPDNTINIKLPSKESFSKQDMINAYKAGAQDYCKSSLGIDSFLGKEVAKFEQSL